MSASINVLIADDSAVIRRMVGEALSNTPGVNVIAVARNGRQAVELKEAKHPDVVLLDIEMPEMDGITALREIRKTDRRTPVIMFSSLTARGAEATLEALSKGASDYVTKPVCSGSIQDSIKYVREQLVPVVLHWGRRFSEQRPKLVPASPPVTIPEVPRSARTPEIIAIGSSTGGPNALADVLSQLPGDLRVPIVIVQHMPPLFTKLLAERLDRSCPLTVREGTDRTPIRPGEVWIAPGDFHMTVAVRDGISRLELNQGSKENSCRPAVDVLFRSVAEQFGGRSLGVVLTGMGKDGAEGCRLLKSKGAPIIVQDEATCVVWGMPRAVQEAGLADSVLPLPEIPAAISRLTQRNRLPALAER
ncbi:MAG: chemotaxis response regulator protein-glutamate methylesterase [Planctomycetaceae bacterium]